MSRALELGEIDVAAQISTGSFERLGGSDDVDAISGVGPYIRVLSFNLCTESRCPDRKVNPAIQDAAVRRAIAYSVDRQRLTLIATSGTSPVAHGVLPTYYKAWSAGRGWTMGWTRHVPIASWIALGTPSGRTG